MQPDEHLVPSSARPLSLTLSLTLCVSLATAKLSKSTKHFADLRTYLHKRRRRRGTGPATDIPKLIYRQIDIFSQCCLACGQERAGDAGRGTFRMREANELEIMRLKFKKRAIYVKNLNKHAAKDF